MNTDDGKRGHEYWYNLGWRRGFGFGVAMTVMIGAILDYIVRAW